jgi:adenylylsulfate kinase
MKLGSTVERSFFKGMVWEVVSFIIVVIAVYLVYGNLTMSIGFSIVLTIIKIPLFFIHERIWKHIKWGKIHNRR